MSESSKQSTAILTHGFTDAQISAKVIRGVERYIRANRTNSFTMEDCLKFALDEIEDVYCRIIQSYNGALPPQCEEEFTALRQRIWSSVEARTRRRAEKALKEGAILEVQKISIDSWVGTELKKAGLDCRFEWKENHVIVYVQVAEDSIVNFEVPYTAFQEGKMEMYIFEILDTVEFIRSTQIRFSAVNRMKFRR